MPSGPIEELSMPVSAEDFAVGQEITPVVKRLSIERMSRPLMAGNNPIHYDAAFAREAGLPGPIATGVMSSAYLSEMLTKAFGVEWIRGGAMDVKFVSPIYAGDVVTAHGRITAKNETSTGVRIALDIWCDTQQGKRVTVGKASVVIHP
jgi:3-hydroxybutyryl-CoA dehydratase